MIGMSYFSFTMQMKGQISDDLDEETMEVKLNDIRRWLHVLAIKGHHCATHVDYFIRVLGEWKNVKTIGLGVLALYPFWVMLNYVFGCGKVIAWGGIVILAWPSPVGKFIRDAGRKVWNVPLVPNDLTTETHSEDTSNMGELNNEDTRKLSIVTPLRATKTFKVHENQRYWIGLGWILRFLPGDPDPWTDHRGFSIKSLSDYILPNDPHGSVLWQWSDVDWKAQVSRDTDSDGWMYADNIWHGWSKEPGKLSYTRRRVWVRKAELLERKATQFDRSASNGKKEQMKTRRNSEKSSVYLQ